MGISGLLSWLVSPQVQARKIGDQMPEFVGIEAWLNSKPLTVAELKGKVVGVQFWTFGCINCKRTLPHMTKLYETYADQGFVLVGVHTPEFSYEREIKNIQTALNNHGILYPVAVDNEFKTWRAYQNRYWPHLFIADQSGRIQFDHIGEGQYDTIDKVVQLLVSQNG
jgi:thiol-disulfide isomerase/thioredoxin